MENVLNFCPCTHYIVNSFLSLSQFLTFPSVAISQVSSKLRTGILKAYSYYSFYYFVLIKKTLNISVYIPLNNGMITALLLGKV